MARQRKASRGKHRWIGFQVENIVQDRSAMEAILEKTLGDMGWRLYDFANSQKPVLCILRVSLPDSDSAISTLNSIKSISTVAKSGKIRLVRERMGLERPPRKR
ncbi:MAG: hypothetical protein QGI73_04540 [Candidatus Thalassarchaeaceae archaeon]|nr:hypothetical protein [Euryarchaeota archaeon]MDP6871481.1 hypothetical protein [Candidatus Thalassarchaeaceae archaeon]